MTLLYLVRHGDTRWEPNERLKGQLDVPLSPVGRRQAGDVADYFRGARADAVYSSTLRRTQEGAGLVAEAVGARVLATPLIDERGWGLWQGLTSREIAKERAAGRTGPDWVGPLGEPVGAFARRVELFLELIAVGRENQTVIAVTHGGVLKNAVLPAIGLSTLDRSAFTADTGSISLLSHDVDGWRPVFLNCMPQRAPIQHSPAPAGHEGS